MKVSSRVRCEQFPCTDVNTNCYLVPSVKVDPDGVTMVMISEAAPEDSNDYYYAKGDPLYQATTVQAFKDAGADVSSIRDLLDLGRRSTGRVYDALCTQNVDDLAVLTDAAGPGQRLQAKDPYIVPALFCQDLRRAIVKAPSGWHGSHPRAPVHKRNDSAEGALVGKGGQDQDNHV